MNEKVIWNYLYGKLKNAYGTAALMGNLFAESSLNPLCANGVRKFGLTNESYTELADHQRDERFCNDGIAYGLAQWCYKTRKKGLLDLAIQQNKSVGDINLQLDYLWKELQSYKTVLNTLYNAESVKEASDIVMLKYEKPANTSETAKEKRAKYGEKYYTQYGDKIINFNLIARTATNLFGALKK